MAPVAVEPLVLLANADKWLTESLESVLTQGGYRVIVTAKRSQVLDVARRQLPDALLLDMALEQRTTDSLALCRALRADPAISRATPIILTTAGPALRAQQLEALRAGAWELRGDPLDVEEMVLRLGVYVQGKLEVDRPGAATNLDNRFTRARPRRVALTAAALRAAATRGVRAAVAHRMDTAPARAASSGRPARPARPARPTRRVAAHDPRPGAPH